MLHVLSRVTAYLLHVHAAWLLSKHYCAAMGFALFEYGLEAYFAPWIKRGNAALVVACIGLLMVVVGEAIRKTGVQNATSKCAFCLCGSCTMWHLSIPEWSMPIRLGQRAQHLVSKELCTQLARCHCTGVLR